jgi:DNA-binding NarL/FixJ family response regulator
MNGTLLVSRFINSFPLIIKFFETLDFKDVSATNEEIDSLIMLINKIKPSKIIIDSDFYSVATPLMVGRILKVFPKLYIAAVSICAYPDKKAVWFIWHGARSYVNFMDGDEEFLRGMTKIREGEDYISSGVQKRMDEFPDWPDTPLKVTKNQKEVLTILYNGFSLEGIMKNMHVCKRTAEYYIEKLKAVFNADTRDELVAIAFHSDMVTKEDLHFKDTSGNVPVLPAWAEMEKDMARGREGGMSR